MTQNEVLGSSDDFQLSTVESFADELVWMVASSAEVLVPLVLPFVEDSVVSDDEVLLLDDEILEVNSCQVEDLSLMSSREAEMTCFLHF